MRILRPHHPVLSPRQYRREPVQPKAPNHVAKQKKRQNAVRINARSAAVQTVAAAQTLAANSVAVRKQMTRRPARRTSLWVGGSARLKARSRVALSNRASVAIV